MSCPAPKRLRAYFQAAGLVGGLVLVALFGLHLAYRELFTVQPAGSIVAAPLLPSTAAGQSIVAEFTGLQRVEVLFATFGQTLTHGQVIFHLRETPTSTTNLVTQQVAAAEILDNSFHAFEFQPLTVPPGSELYFVVETIGMTEAHALTVRGTADPDRYPDGAAYFHDLDDHEIQDLAFRLTYTPPLNQQLRYLLDRITANKPLFFGDPRFYLGLLGSGLALLYLLAVQWLQLLPSPEEKTD